MKRNILEQKINNLEAKIGIIGLGYVGLPLLVEFAKKGFNVIGFDVDKQKISYLKKCKSYITDINNEILKKIKNKTYVTTDFRLLFKCDVVIICVPTPLRKSKEPDISYIIDATKIIAKYLHKNELIILESTSYPGTTREILLTELEKKGLKVGKDFYLGFSPERVDPGNKNYNISNTPKVIGGITKDCTYLMKLLYSKIVNDVVPVSSTEAAETVKLLENTFRAINIGLANEMALICNKLNLDIWEIVRAAGTKPYGFMSFYPGPGLGGHCIPIDPLYLSWKLKTFNFNPRFIELADQINTYMPIYVIERLFKILNSKKITIKGSKILILGVTYKKDVGDIRESPALTIIKELLKEGAIIDYNDPFVNKLDIDNKKMYSVKLSAKALRKYDCVIILADHTKYDYKFIVNNSKIIFDTRNATFNIKNNKIIKL